MELDILSCTNYKHSLTSTNRQATINLPLSNTRAKAILVMPTDSTYYNSAQLIGGIGTYVEESRDGANPNQQFDLQKGSADTGCIDFLKH